MDEPSVARILDLGHGDWEMWPRGFFEGFDYTGLEAVPKLSLALDAKFGNPSTRFLEQDVVGSQWPSADLVLCKDVLIHLPNEAVKKVLRQMAHYRYAIVCTGVLLRPETNRQKAQLIRRRIAPRRRLTEMIMRRSPFGRYWCNNTDIDLGDFRHLDIESSPFDLSELGLKVIDRLDFPAIAGGPTFEVKRAWLLEGSVTAGRPQGGPATGVT